MSEKDLDLEALAQAFQQLQLAAGSLASALQPPASSSHNDDWELVQAEPREPANTLPLGTQDPPSGSSSGPRPFRFRPSPKPLASSQIPPECAQLCVSLAPSVRASRAARAWAAGLQAGLVLRGEQEVVEPTPTITVKNRCYLVLRNASGSPPGFYRTFSEFKAATGPFRPGTVCHGWPTEGEARVYAWAAGQTFPEA